jgi:Domain of unknown function (DUF4349)
MKIKIFFSMLFASSALTLAACSEADQGNSAPAMEGAVQDAAAPLAETAADNEGAQAEAIPVSVPKLAYVYDFLFSLPGEDLRKLQRQHASLCEQQGPQSCQIAGMTTTGEIDETMTGQLDLLVATQHARAFGALLEDEAESAGAEQRTANIATEEVSRQLVDTEARLQSRIELRDRLREVLRTRSGTVEELIEAERGVAAVNEEIDQARAWLAETQGRVAMSRMTVRYESAAPVAGDFLGPVKGALGAVSGILGIVLAAMIIAATVAAPIGAVIWGIRRFRRRAGAAA